MQALLPEGYLFYQFTIIKNTNNFPYTDYTIYTIVVLYAKILYRLTCLPQKYFKQCEEYRTTTLSRRTKNSEKQLVISEKYNIICPVAIFILWLVFFLTLTFMSLFVMAQSQVICDASAMGKTRVIRTKSWDRSHDFAPVGGALRTPAACRNVLGTPVAVTIFEIKIVQLLARFFTHFGHPRHNLRWPPINRVGLQIQVEVQCLQVVSGDLRLNRRRPATTRTLSAIVFDESYGGIVVNRRVYKSAFDRIDLSLRRSCCRRL